MLRKYLILLVISFSIFSSFRFFSITTSSSPLHTLILNLKICSDIVNSGNWDFWIDLILSMARHFFQLTLLKDTQSTTHIPSSRHHNPFLITNRSWILTVHKGRILELWHYLSHNLCSIRLFVDFFVLTCVLNLKLLTSAISCSQYEQNMEINNQFYAI